MPCITTRATPRGQGRGQDGACGPLGAQCDTTHPCYGSPGVVAQVGWDTAVAVAGSPALWVGRVTGKVGGRGREAHRLRARAGSGPRELCWKLLALSWAQALPRLYWEVLLGCTAALTFRENINFGTFIPEGVICEGTKGITWLRIQS